MLERKEQIPRCNSTHQRLRSSKVQAFIFHSRGPWNTLHLSQCICRGLSSSPKDHSAERKSAVPIVRGAKCILTLHTEKLQEAKEWL
jgi:hypothetical protein